MKLRLRFLLEKISIYAILITGGILGYIGLISIFIAVFELNVFTERSVEFTLAATAFLVAFIIAAAVFNVIINISIVAHANPNVEKAGLAESGFFNQKKIMAWLSTIPAILIFLFVADQWYGKTQKTTILQTAQDTITRYQSSVKYIGENLPDRIASKNRILPLQKEMNILSKTSSTLPNISVIFGVEHKGQLLFPLIDDNHPGNPSEREMQSEYLKFYECNLEECSYLQDYFEGRENEYKYVSKGNDFKLFYPVEAKGRKFLLLFESRQRYGSFGS